MASDENQFKRANKKRQELLDNKQFSVSPRLGELAIAFSRYSKKSGREKEKEITFFSDEALDLYSQAYQTRKRALIYDGLDHDTLDSIFASRAISDIILIGNGDLSSIYLDNGKKYDWRNVSESADHLKTGVFMQRFCGNTIRDASVPFSTFAVADHRNIIATPGEPFMPEDYPEDEELLRPVSDTPHLSFNDIKRLFKTDRDWAMRRQYGTIVMGVYSATAQATPTSYSDIAPFDKGREIC